MLDDVRVYVTGSDGRLRSIAWELLLEGLVTHADRLDCGSLYLDGDKKKRKFSNSGVTLVLSTSQEKLEATMTRLRVLGRGDSMRAYAMPVLQSFEQ